MNRGFDSVVQERLLDKDLMAEFGNWRRLRCLLAVACLFNRVFARVATAMRHSARALWLGLALAAASAGAQVLAPAPELNLTDAERAWLAAHPVIRIGVDPAYAPYAFIDSAGQPAGVAAEITEIVRQRLGIRLELVRGLSWPQILEAARKRELDVITTASYRPEREAYLVFTKNYLQTPLVVMTRTLVPPLRDVQQLALQRVALVQGYSSTKLVQARVPAIESVLVDTPLAGLLAVSNGSADAYVGVLGINTYLAARNGISNLTVNSLFDADNAQAYGVRKDWPELAGLLQKALDSISAQQMQQVFARWIPVSVESLSARASVVNAQARARVAAMGELRVGLRRIQPPLNFVDDKGQLAGLSADTLAWLSNKTGMRTRFVDTKDWPSLRAAFDAGDVDLVMAVDRASGMAENTLSDPYYVSALGVFERKGDVFLGSVGDLLDRRVAVRAGGYAEDVLRHFPRILLTPYPDTLDAAQALRDGKVDFLVGETSAAFKTIEGSSLVDLHFASSLNEAPIALRIAVNPRLQGVRQMLNAALGDMSIDEATTIRRRWVGSPVPTPPLVSRPVLIGGMVLLLLVLLGYAAFYGWNQVLRFEIGERKKIATELSQIRLLRERDERQFRQMVDASPNALVMVDKDGTITRATQAIESMLGYTHEELLGQSVEMLVADSMRGGHRESRAQYERTSLPRVMGLSRSVQAQHKDGHLIPVEVRLNPVAIGGDDFVLASLFDLSDRVKAEDDLRLANEMLSERAQELLIEKDRALAADRVKSHFLATMSHELRTPLNSIIGFTGVLRQKLAGPLTPEQDKQLGMVSGSARHLLALINDVLDISKIEAGELKVELAPVDLRAAIDAAVGVVQPLVGKEGLVLRVARSCRRRCRSAPTGAGSTRSCSTC